MKTLSLAKEEEKEKGFFFRDGVLKDEDGDVIGPDRKDSLVVAPQLTLSGHTHAGQISILGLRPSMFTPYDYGLFEEEGCQLYTTSGLGGTVPIRIGATAEIVVITLKRK